MSMKERMHTGELYLPGDKEIMKEQLACLNLLYDFNMTRPTELEKREKCFKKCLLKSAKDAISNRPYTQISVVPMSISGKMSMQTSI